MGGDAQIEIVTGLFAISNGSGKSDFSGLLCPSQDYVFAYGYAAVTVCGKVVKVKGRSAFHGSISSIDDSGVSFHGPSESEKRAIGRCARFRLFIEERHPLMPLKTEIVEWCESNGCTPSFW